MLWSRPVTWGDGSGIWQFRATRHARRWQQLSRRCQSGRTNSPQRTSAAWPRCLTRRLRLHVRWVGRITSSMRRATSYSAPPKCKRKRSNRSRPSGRSSSSLRPPRCPFREAFLTRHNASRAPTNPVLCRKCSQSAGSHLRPCFSGCRPPKCGNATGCRRCRFGRMPSRSGLPRKNGATSGSDLRSGTRPRGRDRPPSFGIPAGCNHPRPLRLPRALGSMRPSDQGTTSRGVPTSSLVSATVPPSGSPVFVLVSQMQPAARIQRVRMR